MKLLIPLKSLSKHRYGFTLPFCNYFVCLWFQLYAIIRKPQNVRFCDQKKTNSNPVFLLFFLDLRSLEMLA